MSLDEIIATKVVDALQNAYQLGIADSESRKNDVMNQQQLMDLLGCRDSKTLKKYYIYKPDFPHLDCQENRWSRTEVKKWLSKHSIPYKEKIR